MLHGILVLSVVMLLHRLVSILTDRSERAEDVVEGKPVLVVNDGRIVERALGAGTLSRRELLMQLRQQGVRDVGEVERAFFSVLQATQNKQKEVESILPRDSRP